MLSVSSNAGATYEYSEELKDSIYTELYNCKVTYQLLIATLEKLDRTVNLYESEWMKYNSLKVAYEAEVAKRKFADSQQDEIQELYLGCASDLDREKVRKRRWRKVAVAAIAILVAENYVLISTR